MINFTHLLDLVDHLHKIVVILHGKFLHSPLLLRPRARLLHLLGWYNRFRQFLRWGLLLCLILIDCKRFDARCRLKSWCLNYEK
jgi:hypothetical protein